MTDDEMLMALADGELPDEVANDLRGKIARHPELAARFAMFKNTTTDLRAAMDPGPVPDRLIAAIAGHCAVIPLRRKSHLPAPVMALAACLVLAVGLGVWIAPRYTQTAALIAAVALSDRLTGDAVSLPDGSNARVLASFATNQGLCRMIDVTETVAIVCRDSADWTVVFEMRRADDSFRPASASEALDQALNSLEAGAALTPEEERAALIRAVDGRD